MSHESWGRLPYAEFEDPYQLPPQPEGYQVARDRTSKPLGRIAYENTQGTPLHEQDNHDDLEATRRRVRDSYDPTELIKAKSQPPADFWDPECRRIDDARQAKIAKLEAEIASPPAERWPLHPQANEITSRILGGSRIAFGDRTKEAHEHIRKTVSTTMFAVEQGLIGDATHVDTEEVKLWLSTDEAHKDGTLTGKLRNLLYSLRPTARLLSRGPVGVFRPGLFGRKSSLNVKASAMDPSCEISDIYRDGTTAHELTHALMAGAGKQHKLTSSTMASKIIDEGLAVAGQQLYYEAVTGETTDVQHEDFDYYADSIEQGGKLKHFHYEPANGALFRYLAMEKGGGVRLNDLIRRINRTSGRQSKVLKSFEQTYGAPLPDLARQAKAWYAERQEKGAILGQRSEYL